MKYWLIILLLAAQVACKKPQRTPYLTLKPDLPIEGQAELYFLEDTYSLFDIATINEENTDLYFRKNIVPEGIYELRINNRIVASIIINSSLPFFISGDFSLSPDQLHISNNDETKALWQAQQLTRSLSEEIRKITYNLPDSLPKKVFESYKESLYQTIDMLIIQSRAKINKISKKHQKSLLPLMLVKLQAGNHLILHPENNSEDYYEICNHLKSRYPDYIPVQKFAFQIDSLMNKDIFNSNSNEN